MLKLIHTSDFHFAAGSAKGSFISAFANEAGNNINGYHNQDVADIAAHFIAQNLSDYDWLLISGDLATRGTIPDLQSAQSYVLSPCSASGGYLTANYKPSLQMGSRPIVIIPGNHDRFHGPAGDPGCTNFDGAFSDHWKVGLGGVQSVKISTNAGTEVSLISADFCLHHRSSASLPGGHFGQGRCLDDTLNELIEQTQSIKRRFPDRGVIWVSHFPPSTDSFTVSVLHELIEGRRLLEAAEKCGISFILCGHLHQHAVVRHGSITIVLAGTMCKWPSATGNWIHALVFEQSGSALDLVSLQNFGYSRNSKEFELDASSSF